VVRAWWGVSASTPRFPRWKNARGQSEPGLASRAIGSERPLPFRRGAT